MLFLAAGSVAGFGGAVVDAIFNNFLSDRFRLGNVERTLLEVPRETPGLLVVFVSGLFFFLCSRRLAVLANVAAAAGLVLIGLGGKTFPITLVFLFVFSVGQHLYMPLSSGIGMSLAGEGRDGKVLGDLSGAANLAAIVGSFVVFIGFSRLHFTYTVGFLLAAGALVVASICLYRMTPDEPVPVKTRFAVHKEYRLYYVLSVLYGTRKQIFITFAPWVLVTVFDQKVQALATLLTVGGIVGILFKPLLGRAIDRFGERLILVGEALLLIVVCIGYGFAKSVLPAGTALAVVFACFVADQLLMSVGMARATYLKKIARRPEDVTPTLTMGVSIDHVFSITIAVVSGAIWAAVGYRWVFLLGACLALGNLAAALRVPPLRSKVAG